MNQLNELTLKENNNFLHKLKITMNTMDNLRKSYEFQKFYDPKKGKYFDDKYKIFTNCQDQIESLIEEIEIESEVK